MHGVSRISVVETQIRKNHVIYIYIYQDTSNQKCKDKSCVCTLDVHVWMLHYGSYCAYKCLWSMVIVCDSLYLITLREVMVIFPFNKLRFHPTKITSNRCCRGHWPPESFTPSPTLASCQISSSCILEAQNTPRGKWDCIILYQLYGWKKEQTKEPVTKAKIIL